jgi:tRNA(Ile)-lysidine synthase
VSSPTAQAASFPRQTAAFARRNTLIGEDSRVLVALSGGPDSCALLLALYVAAKSGLLPAPVGAAHFHHGLRGGDADDDAAFAAALCTRIGAPCVVGIGAARPESGQSPNDAARRARYAFLEEAARDLGADTIATGHTLDDQAETVLGRVLRGAGVDGLAGIPLRRTLATGLVVVRPLLAQRRADVLEWCAANDIEPRQDPSNFKPRYSRSRLRARLPELARDFNPRLTEALGRRADPAARDTDLLGALAEALWHSAAGIDADGTLRLRAEPLRAAHPALRGRALLRALRTGSPNAAEAATGAFVARLEAALDDSSASFDLPGACRAWREGDDLLLAAPPRDAPPRPPEEMRLPLRGAANLTALGLCVTARERQADDIPLRVRRSPAVEIAYNGAALTLRTARSGDRMAPLGMGGQTRLLSDILAEAGCPAAARHAAPLVADTASGEVLWVIGICQAESTRVRDDTPRVLRLEAQWNR